MSELKFPTEILKVNLYGLLY